MKKVLVIIGIVLCLFGITSCKREIQEVNVYRSYDSTPRKIIDKEEIVELEKMILNQKYKKDDEKIYEKENSIYWWLYFLDINNKFIGDSNHYEVLESGYVFYVKYVNDQEIVYVSKNKIDYQKFLRIVE